MSHPKHYVIHVPGLGDSYDSGRKFALKAWRIYGVRAELVHMNWDSEKAYRPKYERIVEAVMMATKKGYPVSLVADSAGASVALNVFADHADKIHRVITVCGVNSPKLTLRDAIKLKNPALDDSIKHLTRSLQRIDASRVTSLRSRRDTVVADNISSVKGATNEYLPMIGHTLAISFALTLGALMIVRRAKRP